MKNKWIFGLVAAALSSLSLVEAQAPPPTAAQPPDAGPMSRVSGSVSQFNYDPEGRIEGFLLTPRTLVFLPPEEAMQSEGEYQARRARRRHRVFTKLAQRHADHGCRDHSRRR